MNELFLVPIIVALIGGPLMWFLARFDRRNTEQHGANMDSLSSMRKEVLEEVRGVASDVRDVKQDVHQLKSDHRALAKEQRRIAKQFKKQQ